MEFRDSDWEGDWGSLCFLISQFDPRTKSERNICEGHGVEFPLYIEELRGFLI